MRRKSNMRFIPTKIVIFNFMHSLFKLAITILVAMMFCFTGVASALNTPVLEWSWTSSSVFPTSINVIMTPSVIDLTNDGIPDVVFASTASTTGGYNQQVGVLRALRGDNGSELFTVTNPSYFINTASSIATGDIDGDGMPEIIASDASGSHLIAFENDGAFKWLSATLESLVYWGAPAIADLDKDGIPEIIIGREALDNNGNILWTGTGGRGGPSIYGSLSLVADVDVDGNPEVVAGNTVYSADGSIKWQNVSLPDGFNAVGNFDADSNAEIVLVSGGSVWLLDHDLSIKWGPITIPGGGVGGPPTIADCDGDGDPEIGVAGASKYALFETNGTLKWAADTQDTSSQRTGSSAFDFEGDGLAEIIYRDELNLYIYRGTDGSVLFQTPLSSCTWLEYPFVADVDGDKDAELLAVANNNCYSYPGMQRGIFVYGDPLQQWGHVRKIWNEHTYHITNVNSNGTIPADEQQNWLNPGLNNFRVNGFYDDQDGVPDAEDSCPESNLEGTVIIDDCVTGVVNDQVNNGCTMSDLIAECAEGTKNHGKFVSCVAHLTNDWKKAGLISGKEKGKIQKCSAQADIP